MQVALAAASGRAAAWRSRGRRSRARSVWKARSQAAYQGYSHLSGIEMMSSLTMWNQSRLRDRLRLAGCSGSAPCSSSHVSSVEVVVLLAPEHAGERLAHDAAPRRRRRRRRGDRRVELVGLAQARLRTIVVEVAPNGSAPLRRRAGRVRRSRTIAGLPGADRQLVVRGGLGARAAPGLTASLLPVDDVVVDAVLDVRRLRSGVPKSRCVVGLVLGEEQRRVALAVQVVRRRARHASPRSRARPPAAVDLLERRASAASRPPRPVVAEPERRQHVQLAASGPRLQTRDPDQDVVGRGLGVLDETSK